MSSTDPRFRFSVSTKDIKHIVNPVRIDARRAALLKYIAYGMVVKHGVDHPLEEIDARLFLGSQIIEVTKVLMGLSDEEVAANPAVNNIFVTCIRHSINDINDINEEVDDPTAGGEFYAEALSREAKRLANKSDKDLALILTDAKGEIERYFRRD